MTIINKLLLGATVLSACYLTGCVPTPDNSANQNNSTTQNNSTNHTSKHDVTYSDTDTLVTVVLDSARNVKSAYLSKINLEPGKKTWNNAKLIGKDEGFISHSKYKGDGEIGLEYVYGEYLFQSPIGTEIILFGKEETLFVGQNYNIDFYKIKPNQNISAEMILEAFKIERSMFQAVHSDKENVGSKLEGYLSKYDRVTK